MSSNGKSPSHANAYAHARAHQRQQQLQRQQRRLRQQQQQRQLQQQKEKEQQWQQQQQQQQEGQQIQPQQQQQQHEDKQQKEPEQTLQQQQQQPKEEQRQQEDKTQESKTTHQTHLQTLKQQQLRKQQIQVQHSKQQYKQQQQQQQQQKIQQQRRQNEPNFASNNNLQITPSADDILGVSPVNTVEEPSPLAAATSRLNDSAFSSTSSSGSSNGGEPDDDAISFVSSEDGGDKQPSTPKKEPQKTDSFTPSEFDKALTRGKPSRGYATSFFPTSTNATNQETEVQLEETESKSTISTSVSTTHNNNNQSTSAVGHVNTTGNNRHGNNSTNLPLKTPPRAPSMPTPPRINSAPSGSTMASARSNSVATNKTRPDPQPVQTVPSSATSVSASSSGQHHQQLQIQYDEVSSGVLPDVLMTMRQKIESLTLFDSDMMRLANDEAHAMATADPMMAETRESLKRSSQQSISAAVLVSLAHKRYERRRLAAMEIEKVVRSLVEENELERVRAILLLLSDDYVRSTSEDARKGGVVALAASAIGLKKAADSNIVAQECRDLILASVVHACQDHSQRVRYYATESLFNVVKVIPALAVQHFFILFEILRSLYADVDSDVRSGADMLDKKLKEVIVGAMNSGSFTADACVPVFARFVYMRHKATKRLTLTWLQELNEKLIGSPILEFLHLFLGGIFDMVADPTIAIRQSALAFLQSVLPKLLVVHNGESSAIDDYIESESMKVDFDKILQSLVTTMEHPDPFVRKVAMYWMSRIVKAHMGNLDSNVNNNKVKGHNNSRTLGISPSKSRDEKTDPKDDITESPAVDDNEEVNQQPLSAVTISVRNSLPHVLPGVLLSIGDTFHSKATAKDSFLPDQTTRALASQTNSCLQEAVRRDGKAYVQHLDSFIVALREELDSPGGLSTRNPPAVERKPYRMDVKHDGTGIESQGWFRASTDTKEQDEDSMLMSRLCALHWVIVLYESVVPDVLKADYSREFIIPIIHQLVGNPPERIVFKSLEVLAKITVPVTGESNFSRQWQTSSLSGLAAAPPPWATTAEGDAEGEFAFPINDSNIEFALDILDMTKRQLKSRDREVFSALIQLHSYNLHLLADLSRVIAFMCRLQPAEFVFVSFAVELERFIKRREDKAASPVGEAYSRDLEFVSSFIQQMCHVLLTAEETKELRSTLKDCIGFRADSERDRRRSRLFHILLHSFSHNLVSAVALCLWGGAYRSASLFLRNIDPLDVHLMFLLELDKLVEMIERPLFRHLHVRMLECDKYPMAEGSGTMLFQTLKSLLMLLPQSTCFNVLRDRLVSTSRFRQSCINILYGKDDGALSKETEMFVYRVMEVRKIHCTAMWKTIRADSLETALALANGGVGDMQLPLGREEGDDRREWLGYASKEEERIAQARYREEQRRRHETFSIEEVCGTYNELEVMIENSDHVGLGSSLQVESKDPPGGKESKDESWKDYWAQPDP